MVAQRNIMNARGNVTTEDDASVTETLQRQQSEKESSSVATASHAASHRSPPPPLPPPHQPQPTNIHGNGISPSAAIVSDCSSAARVIHRPRLTPCSLNASTWSKRRILIASCGCLSSAIVCTVRLLLDPGPSAYVIHSIIILIDMVLIHVFTYSPGLSIVGEGTAIIFASLFHATKHKVFELLETTLIAVWVSIHMIKSRGDHWGREEELERDFIGLQLYVEHHAVADDYGDDGNDKKLKTRRMSSLSWRQDSLLSKSDVKHSQGSSEADNDDAGGVEGDVKAGVGGRVRVQQSTTTNISAFTASISRRLRINTASGEEARDPTHWWNNFFDHFLDGSAGVMYTSFLGLIIDEIVNLNSSKKTY